MKNYWIIIVLVVFGYNITYAQTNNELIYKEIDSDFQTYYLNDSRHIDINNDSVSDFFFNTFLSGYYWAYGIWPEANWNCCSYHPEVYHPGVNNTFDDLSIPLDDNSMAWSADQFFVEHLYCDTSSYKVALRYRNGDDYYYGWVEIYLIYSSNTFYKLKVSRTCFCTIPNYPLRWGQTSLTDGYEENQATAFATLHPNPTTGLVTIIGKELKHAEVFNALGQRLATAQGEGERLTVDISALPAGIYFINITNEEGRKCVRKVVKE